MSIFNQIKIDWKLLIYLLLIAVFGLIVLYSASAFNIETVIRQGIHFGIGIFAMIAISQFPPRILKNIAIYLVIFGIILLIIVYLFGTVRGGAKRWINLGFMMFQPSELMKLVVPIAIASILSYDNLPPSFSSVLYSLIIIGLSFMLIVIQPDLGTSIIIASSGLFALFFSGFNIQIFKNPYINISVITSTVIGILTFAWTFLLQNYQKNRILTLFNPESDPLGKGYHIIQSKIAIGSGGMFGKGYGNGTQTQLDFLPEHSTDFIFALIAEEFGFIGILILLFLYSLILWRCLVIALGTSDTFEKLITASLIMIFFSYIFINIGMVSGMLPIVGVPLPFISYGGSSVLTLMFGFGVIMSVHNHKKPEYLN